MINNTARCIAVFLFMLCAVLFLPSCSLGSKHKSPPPPKAGNAANGKAIYFQGTANVKACAACHGHNGLGISGKGRTLHTSDYKDKSYSDMIRLLTFRTWPSTSTDPNMRIMVNIVHRLSKSQKADLAKFIAYTLLKLPHEIAPAPTHQHQSPGQYLRRVLIQ